MSHLDHVTEFKERLRAGSPLIGTWLMGTRSPAFVRLLAAAGYDFVIVDTQHVALSEETVADMCEVAAAAQLPLLVRVSETSAARINRALDFGAAGVVCPDCRDAATVAAAVDGMRFPPSGRRSAMGAHPGLGFATRLTRDDLSTLEEGAFLGIQIESREGISNLDAILEQGGVDVVDIGRGDLAIDLGGAVANADPTAGHVDEIVRIASTHGTRVGITCGSPEEAARLIRRGITFISYSSDRRILADAYREGLGAIRRLLESAG